METFLWVFSSIMMVFGVIYIMLKSHEHKDICNRRINAIKDLKLPLLYQENISDLVRRTYVFYYSYALQNIITILCALFSLVYSVFALLRFSGEDVDTIISLMAIIFVVISIYVNPQRRKTQYLQAWRSAESLTLTVFCKLMDDKSLKKNNYDQLRALCEMIQTEREKIEASITVEGE